MQNDVSSNQVECLFLLQPMKDQFDEDYYVLGIYVDRHKTGTSEPLPFLMYPDINEMAKDVYFSLAYYFILCKDYSSRFTFDSLANRVFAKAGKKKKEGEIASVVSHEWKRLYNDVVIKTYKKYKHAFPDGMEGKEQLKVSYLDVFYL